MSHRLTQAQFVHRVRQQHGKLYTVIGTYVGQTTKVETRCNVCCNTWQPTPSDLWRGSGCPTCSKPGLKPPNAVEYLALLRASCNANLTLLKYVSMLEPASFLCVRGHTFQRSPRFALTAKVACPVCLLTSLTYGRENRYIVDALSRLNYNRYKKIINPNNLGSKTGHSVDHIYSVYDYFKNPKRLVKPIEIYEVAHPANLRMITCSENSRKSRRSDITVTTLRKNIRSFNKKFGYVLPSTRAIDLQLKRHTENR